MFDDCHYHQIFGGPMGSPVSAVIAELVMQRIEKVALESSSVSVRWWKSMWTTLIGLLKTTGRSAIPSTSKLH